MQLCLLGYATMRFVRSKLPTFSLSKNSLLSMKHLLILVLLLWYAFGSGTVHAQTDAPAPPPFPVAPAWLKEFEPLLNRDTERIAFLRKGDSLYVLYHVIGGPIRTTGFDPNEAIQIGTEDILLIKCDALTGKVAWRCLYDSPTHGIDSPVTLLFDTQGNIIIGGFTDAGGRSRQGGFGATIDNILVVLKVSPAGRLLWAGHWKPKAVGVVDTLTGLVVSNRGTIYAVCRLAIDVGRHIDTVIVNFTVDGGVAWAKRHIGGTTDSFCIPGEAVVDERNNLIFCGTATTFNTASGIKPRLFLAQYAPDGKQQWIQRFEFGSKEQMGLHLLVRDPADGSLIAAGSSGVARFDATGKQLWTTEATQTFAKNAAELIRPLQLMLSETGDVYLFSRQGQYHTPLVTRFNKQTGKPVEP